MESTLEHKRYHLETTQHLVHALHSDSGSNLHVSIAYGAARPASSKQVFSTARPYLKSQRFKYRLVAMKTCAQSSF